MAIKVDIEKCTGCGACAEVCPVEAITVGKKAQIDEEICIECQACVIECPEGAILVENERVNNTPVNPEPGMRGRESRSKDGDDGFSPLRANPARVGHGQGTLGGFRGAIDRIFGRIGGRGGGGGLGRGTGRGRGRGGRGGGRRGW